MAIIIFFFYPHCGSVILFFLCVVKAADKYPYFPGQEPTLSGEVQFLLQVHCFTKPTFV